MSEHSDGAVIKYDVSRQLNEDDHWFQSLRRENPRKFGQFVELWGQGEKLSI